MRVSASREDIVREALSWVGTPFHDCADVKGAGVDCAMLLVRVFCDLGVVPPIDPRPYKPQWFLHQDEPLFLKWLESCSVKVDRPLPGDVALLHFGKQDAHGAVIVDEYTMVHAYKPAGKVIRDSRRGLQHRVKSYWSPLSFGAADG